MPDDRHTVKIPDAMWDEVQRILLALPSVARTPSGFVLRAVQNEIERIWKEFRLTPGGGPGTRFT